jgi:hypothetical protein
MTHTRIQGMAMLCGVQFGGVAMAARCRHTVTLVDCCVRCVQRWTDDTVATLTVPHPMPTPPSIMIWYASHQQSLHLSHSPLRATRLLRPRVRHLLSSAQPYYYWVHRGTVARVPAPCRQPIRT